MSPEKISVWEKILAFIKKSIPGIVLMFYNHLLRQVSQAEREKQKAELETEYAKNKMETDREHANRPSADIVRDAIIEGKLGDPYPYRNDSGPDVSDAPGESSPGDTPIKKK